MSLPLTKIAIAALAGLAAATFVAARPLTAPPADTVEIAAMTWVEVRDAIGRGATTVIVPSGGLEQNGIHMAIGKHDAIVGWTARRIAQDLGHALVAPVLPFVPEGDWDPQTGNMTRPGTIGVSEAAFEATLEGIARSLKAAGFTTICFIADHGESQRPQAAVASRLDRDWATAGVRVVSVDSYYAVREQDAWLLAHGETEATMGNHAGLADTSELLAVDPGAVALDRLGRTGWSLEATGGSGEPARATAEIGRALLAIKVEAAIRQIRALRAPA